MGKELQQKQPKQYNSNWGVKRISYILNLAEIVPGITEGREEVKFPGGTL
jgi:hypothetical protein